MKMKIYYRLIIRETNQTRLRVQEVHEDKKYLEDKAKKLEEEHPDWQVFVVRENYNVS
tara:strand:+ start:2761 stop:2934 length:174 start_codon:yes stop_codon:yes gene_type:complete